MQIFSFGGIAPPCSLQIRIHPTSIYLQGAGDTENFCMLLPPNRNINMEITITKYTLFFYKEPTSRPSSKSSLFIDLKSANCSTKSSLIVP